MKRLSLALLLLSTASCTSPRGQGHEHWNSGATLNRSLAYHFFSYNTDLETWGPYSRIPRTLARHFANVSHGNPLQDSSMPLHRRGRSHNGAAAEELVRPADFKVTER